MGELIHPSQPCVSIFIPTYNDQTDLSACLESLRCLDYPKQKIEIVIWDNHSFDDTISMVEERFREMKGERWLSLKLIKGEKNEGPYVPYSLAFLHSPSPQTEHVLGLDADVELAPDALGHLMAAMQGERVAVVGARSVFYDQPEKTAHGAGFVNRWTAKYGEKDARELIECDYVIGCCWLFDQKVFREVGGLDSDFFINHWEVDYSLRVKMGGYRIQYEPRAIARHKIPYGGTWNAERIYYMFRNKLLMIKKNRYFVNRTLTTVLCFVLSFGRIISSSVWKMSMRDTFNACHGLYDGLMGVTGEQER